MGKYLFISTTFPILTILPGKGEIFHMKKIFLVFAFLSCTISFLTACSDEGLEPQHEIAAYDKLPRFCEELDTVRLSTTGALFYCENGEWIEIGAVLPKPKSSSSSKKKETVSSSSEEDEPGYDEEVSSSSDEEGSSSEEEKSTGKSNANEEDSHSESTDNSSSSKEKSSSSSAAPAHDPAFNFLDGAVEWGTRSFHLKPDISSTYFYTRLNQNGFSQADLSGLKDFLISMLGDSLKIAYDLSNFENLYVKEVEDVTYYITSLHSSVGSMFGTYPGKFDDLMNSMKNVWPSGYTNGSLWTMNPSLAYQVQTPEVVECTGGEPFVMDDYGLGCFQATGGWWFVYDAQIPGTSTRFDPIQYHNGYPELITTDPSSGEIVPDGNLVEGKGLQVAMFATGEDVLSPGVAGLAFYWTKNEEPVNIRSHDGICLAYYWDGDINLQIELRWPFSYGDDTFYYELTPGVRVVKIPWASFQKEGWDASHKDATIITATEEAVELSFRIFNPSADEHGGTFRLATLGWYWDCGAE